MSRRQRQAKREREATKDPDWEPRFNDPELRRAYEDTRPVFDRCRWDQAWRETTKAKEMK